MAINTNKRKVTVITKNDDKKLLYEQVKQPKEFK